MLFFISSNTFTYSLLGSLNLLASLKFKDCLFEEVNEWIEKINNTDWFFVANLKCPFFGQRPIWNFLE